MHNSLLQLLFKNCDFLNTDISQGSVAIHLQCGGEFKYSFVTNFLLSLTLKVMGKSLVSCFFETQCVMPLVNGLVICSFFTA